MKKMILAVAMLLCLASCGTGELVIMHFNDTHSHLDVLRDGSGGVIERTAFIDSVRKADGPRNTLLLHAGDFSQGSSYFTLLDGDLEIDLINAMKYDCITIGNHEFDNGLEELGRRLSRVNCPVVCANYDFSSFDFLQCIKPYTIIRRAGRKIGIIGILCNISTVVSRATADRVPKFDTREVLNKWADYLKEEEKCDLVIVLSHAGFRGEPGGINDVEMVPVTRNVDIIVGGHSHTRLREMYVGKNLDGKDVPVVQNWCWGHEGAILRVY